MGADPDSRDNNAEIGKSYITSPKNCHRYAQFNWFARNRMSYECCHGMRSICPKEEEKN